MLLGACCLPTCTVFQTLNVEVHSGFYPKQCCSMCLSLRMTWVAFKNLLSRLESEQNRILMCVSGGEDQGMSALNIENITKVQQNRKAFIPLSNWGPQQNTHARFEFVHLSYLNCVFPRPCHLLHFILQSGQYLVFIWIFLLSTPWGHMLMRPGEACLLRSIKAAISSSPSQMLSYVSSNYV